MQLAFFFFFCSKRKVLFNFLLHWKCRKPFSCWPESILTYFCLGGEPKVNSPSGQFPGLAANFSPFRHVGLHRHVIGSAPTTKSTALSCNNVSIARQIRQGRGGGLFFSLLWLPPDRLSFLCWVFHTQFHTRPVWAHLIRAQDCGPVNVLMFAWAHGVSTVGSARRQCAQTTDTHWKSDQPRRTNKHVPQKTTANSMPVALHEVGI